MTDAEPRKPALLVLAAGMGHRFGGDKQVQQVGPSGETIIDYTIHDAIHAGFGKVVLVIRRHMAEDIADTLVRRWRDSIDVRLAFQELDMALGDLPVPPGRVKPWGTGHAVLVAESEIDEPFAVVNADDFYGASSFQELASFLSAPNQTEYCMVGFRLGRTLSPEGQVSRGVCTIDSAGYLESIAEHTKVGIDGGTITGTSPEGLVHTLEPSQPVSMNLWGFQASLLDHLDRGFTEFLETAHDDQKREYLLPAIVDELIACGQTRVRVLDTTEDWLGLTYKEDTVRVRARLQELHDAGAYPKCLWEPLESE